MIVTLDGRKLEQLTTFRGTLEALVARARAELTDEQIIVAVTINGRELVGEELNRQLSSEVSNDVQVDLECAAPREIAAAALRESADRLELAAEAMSEVATDFQAGRFTAATGGLTSLLAVWNTCQQTLGQAGTLLHRDLTHELHDGETLIALLGKVAETLRSLRDAVEARDSVLIADLLEYEMPGLCQRWNRILQHLADEVERTATAAA